MPVLPALLGSCSSTVPTRVWHAPAVAPFVASCPMTDPVRVRDGVVVTRQGALRQSSIGRLGAGRTSVELLALANPCVTGDGRRWTLVFASKSDTLLYRLGATDDRVEILRPPDTVAVWYEMSTADAPAARKRGWKVVQVGWESDPTLRTCLDTLTLGFHRCPR